MPSCTNKPFMVVVMASWVVGIAVIITKLYVRDIYSP